MRISCDVEVVNRTLPSHGFKGNRRGIRTSLAIGRRLSSTKTATDGDIFLMLCTAKDRKGSKYKVKNNIIALFTRFLQDGKATIRIKEPPEDLCLSKADPLQLKNFLGAVKLGHQDKELSHSHLTPLTTATIAQVERPKTKMTIIDRKEYPITTGFPKTLEKLQVSNCKLLRLDSRIFDLSSLQQLDLSVNHICKLPDSWGRLTCLTDLNLSSNKIEYLPRSFIKSFLQNTLQSLNLSDNELKFLPPDFCAFSNLVRLNLSSNSLEELPSRLGAISGLKHLCVSKNQLHSLPYSCSKLNLDEVDLFENPLPIRSEQKVIPMDKFFPSLVELSGRAIVKYRISYCYETIPITLCHMLDAANQCMCNRFCFRWFATCILPFDLHKISSTVTGGINTVPLTGVLCSAYCAKVWTKGGGEWRRWTRSSKNPRW